MADPQGEEDQVTEQIEQLQLGGPSTSVVESTPEAQAERRRGTVRWFNASKGFGFIQPEGAEGGSEDLFVHQVRRHAEAILHMHVEGGHFDAPVELPWIALFASGRGRCKSWPTSRCCDPWARSVAAASLLSWRPADHPGPYGLPAGGLKLLPPANASSFVEHRPAGYCRL